MSSDIFNNCTEEDARHLVWYTAVLTITMATSYAVIWLFDN